MPASFKNDNIQEQSIMPQGLSPEEVAKLSDEEILKMVIAEKRTRISRDQSIRTANLRRRSRHAVTPTRSK